MHDLTRFVAVLSTAIACAGMTRAQALSGGFVYLRDIDSSIIQDIRYTGSNNFVGRPLSGYGAGECVVKREVGRRPKAIQQELVARRPSLKMLDCYRPARVVADMVVCPENGTESVERQFNPAFNKKDLFRLGYIATHSGHSAGAAVDLILVDLAADNSATFDPHKSYADCTAPAEARAPERSLDMGTGYNCSDPGGTPRRCRSHLPSVASAMLVAAMAGQGFVNYSKEWWHFSLPGAGGPAYDFPIQPRRN